MQNTRMKHFQHIRKKTNLWDVGGRDITTITCTKVFCIFNHDSEEQNEQVWNEFCYLNPLQHPAE